MAGQGIRRWIDEGAVAEIPGGDHMVFPLTAVFAAHPMGSRHRPVMLAMIGREGAADRSFLPGLAEGVTFNCIVAGEALVVPSADARRGIDRSSACQRLFAAFAQCVTAQMADTILAAAGHRVPARLARLLLMLHDRQEGDVLHMTHDQLARCLGVRRASVTDTLHVMEGDRLIRNSRNLIEISDRPGLSRLAHPGYGGAERLYSRLIGPLGRNDR